MTQQNLYEWFRPLHCRVGCSHDFPIGPNRVLAFQDLKKPAQGHEVDKVLEKGRSW